MNALAVPVESSRWLFEEIDWLVVRPGEAERTFAAIDPPRVSRVIAAVDGRAPSAGVLGWATRVAGVSDAPAVVATVVGPAAGITMQEAHDLQARAPAGWVRLVTHGDAVSQMIHVAQPGDLVVVGTRERPALGRLLLGSVGDAVRVHSPAHLLIARGEPPPSRVLAPVDGSWLSKGAAAVAMRIASAFGAPLDVLYALPTDAASDSPPTEFTSRPPGSDGPAIRFRRVRGSPASVIVDAAQQGTLVVMGAFGAGRLGGAMSGGTSAKVAHEAAGSVLILKT